jgi:hypothetical protein
MLYCTFGETVTCSEATGAVVLGEPAGAMTSIVYFPTGTFK